MAAIGPEAACIFRITHVNNLPWILDHGLHCENSDVKDPGFVPIGMADLIKKRRGRPVPIGPGGTLSDYIPFYFTPHSIMMFNIKTGHNGVIRRPNRDIAILVSSLHKLRDLGARFAFTDSHAYLQEADYYQDLACLDRIDWGLLRRRDFRTDPNDPGKFGRYQAEALVHSVVPVDALLGIACYDDLARASIRANLETRGLTIRVKSLPRWHF